MLPKNGNTAVKIVNKKTDEVDSPTREAIIFVPGISQEEIDQTVEGVTLRLATAMDRNATSARAKFRVGKIRKEPFSRGLHAQTATIFRKDEEDEGEERPLVDVYKMEYGNLLLKKYRDAHPLVTIWRLPSAIIPTGRRLLTSLRNRSLTWKEKLQFALVFLMLLVLFGYMVLLGTALLITLWEVVSNYLGSQWLNNLEAGVAPQFRALSASISSWVTFLVVLLTAVGFVVPSRAEIRRAFVEGATLVTAIIFYFQAGERRRVLSGQLRDLLEHILEQPEVNYAKVHIIAYSFGSITALDTLFPVERAPGERFKAVHSLVTIGSPFDFVHLIWPRYFAERRALPELRWYNIYSPEDVLASNFRSYSKAESARAGKVEPSASGETPQDATWMKPPTNIKYSLRIGRDELAWYEPFMFMGLRNHSLYWEPEDEPQINAFDAAVTSMFAGEPVLQ